MSKETSELLPMYHPHKMYTGLKEFVQSHWLNDDIRPRNHTTVSCIFKEDTNLIIILTSSYTYPCRVAAPDHKI